MNLNNILFKKEGTIAILKLNRPNVLNAMNEQLWRELEKVILSVRDDQEIKVLIITGEGKAFSVGADIKEMQDFYSEKSDYFEARLNIQRMQKITKDLIDLPKPVIAAVNGYALGAGAELAVMCDIRIASDQAKIGFPEVKVGLFETNGVTYILPSLVGSGNAKYLMMTGDAINANEAQKIGLFERVVPHQELMGEAKKLALRISANAPVSVALAKKCINKGTESDLDTALVYETEALMACLVTDDAREGALAFLENREPSFKGK